MGRAALALSVVPLVVIAQACLEKDNPLWAGTQGDSGSTSTATPDSSSASTATTVSRSTTSPSTSGSSGSSSGADSTGTDGPIEFGPWSPPAPVVELDLDGVDEDDPTLTADQLEMYIGAQDGPEKIYVSTRPSLSDPWSVPQLVPELDSTTRDRGTPEVSADGLVIFLHDAPMNVDGIDDIYVSTRANRSAEWGPLVLATALNSADDELAATPIWDIGRLFLCSNRRPDDVSSDIYEAQIDLGFPLSLNPPTIVAALATSADECSVHATPDGLSILFESNRPGGMGGFDIWTATRPTLDDPFESIQLLDGVNGPLSDRDPWLSEDGRTLYFARGDNSTTIYVTTREPL